MSISDIDHARFIIPALPISSGVLYLTCACIDNREWPKTERDRVKSRKYGDNTLFTHLMVTPVDSVWVLFTVERFEYVCGSGHNAE
jgi:hypothetical protein